MLREKTAELLSIKTSPDPKFFVDFTNVEVEKSYWVFITVLPIPQSERKNSETHNQMTQSGYRIPKMIELVAFFTGARINNEQDFNARSIFKMSRECSLFNNCDRERTY